MCRYDQQIKQLQGVPRDIQALNDQYSLFGSPKYLESPDDRKLAIKQNKVYVETAKVSLSTSTSDSLIDGLLALAWSVVWYQPPPLMVRLHCSHTA